MIKVGPEVSLENHPAVYDFFEGQKISKPVARFAHFVLGHVYRPEIEFIGQAEEQIKEHFDAGKTVILASTHGLLDDPFVLAAIAKREKALRPLRKNTVIPAKESVFKLSKIPTVDKALRVVLDNFIALPTFRDKDYPLDEMSDAERKRTENLLRAANSILIGQCVERLDDGNNLAIFPEGTRGDDPDEIQPLKTGISRMAHRTNRTDELAVIPVAIRYTHERKIKRKDGENSIVFNARRAKNFWKRLKPKVAVGEISPVAESEEAFLTTVQEGLQSCVNKTKEMAA